LKNPNELKEELSEEEMQKLARSKKKNGKEKTGFIKTI